MRLVSRLVGGLLFVLMALAPQASVPVAAQGVKVSVAYSNIAGGELPLWTATDDGYFNNNGVSADVQLISGGANTVAALVSGQVQIAHAGGSEALSAIANGADLVVLATLTPVYAYVLEVSPDINSPKDLVGKKLGVATFGGSADIATRVVLRQAGIDPDADVTMVATGSAANRTAALLAGAIQGGMAAGPPDTLSLEAQGLHPLFDLAALKLPAAIDTIIAQRGWVNSNHDLVQWYIDSIVQSAVRAKQDRDGSIAILKKYYNSDDDAAMNATYDFNINEVIPTLPFPNAEQFHDAVQQLSVNNPRIADVDLTKVLEPEFVQSAADRGLGD
jgi:ABC-type nitrate/sulfonate/bicarbonate transport system substrate-binding protein